MRLFLDTNVLVAAVSDEHSHHAQAFTILERVQSENDEGLIAAHSLAEMYAILTRLPVPFRHTPEQALLSIEENVLKHFTIITLTGNDYASVLRDSAIAGVQGGMIYDAILLRSAAKAAVDRIYTFNLKHFKAIASKAILPLIASP